MSAERTPSLGGSRARIAGLSLVVALIVAAIGWLLGEGDEKPLPRAEVGEHQPAPGTSPPAGSGVEAPEGQPAPRIAVTGRRVQRIQGWGMSVLSEGRGEPIVSGSGLSRSRLGALERLVFRKAGINLVRVFGPTAGGTGTESGVGLWPRSDRRLRFMRRASRHGVRFMFTGGGAPLRMRQGGSPTGALVPGRERAYARFLAKGIEVAEKAGARFKWAAIGNEPDIFGAGWVAMEPAQAAAVYRSLASEIRSRGLRPRLVLGDNEGWGATYEYSRLAGRSRAVRRLASLVASHGYSDVEPTAVQRVSGFAKEGGLSLWMTEWVGGCTAGLGTTEAQLDLALGWASRISFDLTVGDVQAWFMLQGVAPSFHGAGCGIAVRQYGNRERPYAVNKRYWTLRQFTSVAPPGAYRYEVASDAHRIAAVAFRRGPKTGLVLTNPADLAATVRVDLGDRGTLTVRRTSATENFKLVGRSSDAGGDLTQVLRPQSITTFKLVER